jgi:hypothetical protein
MFIQNATGARCEGLVWSNVTIRLVSGLLIGFVMLGSAASPVAATSCSELTTGKAISATRLLIRGSNPETRRSFLSEGEGAWIHGCRADVVSKFNAVPRAIDWSIYVADIIYLTDQDRWEFEDLTVDEWQ